MLLRLTPCARDLDNRSVAKHDMSNEPIECRHVNREVNFRCRVVRIV